MFTTKLKPLPLTQSENYSFVASSDKISSNIKKIHQLKFLNYLGVSKQPTKISMISEKIDLICKKICC